MGLEETHRLAMQHWVAALSSTQSKSCPLNLHLNQYNLCTCIPTSAPAVPADALISCFFLAIRGNVVREATFVTNYWVSIVVIVVVVTVIVGASIIVVVVSVVTVIVATSIIP